MRHTKHIVGGFLIAALTISGVVAVDALGTIDRAARVGTPALRVDPPPSPSTSTSIASDLSLVVDLINAERAQRGLPPLVWHDQVAAAATVHSTDMAAHGVMSHTGSDGSDAGDRLHREGFDWSAWGENIAAGFRSARPVFDAWMASAGHRRQILGNFTYVGVAAVAGADGTPYWTLDFAS